MKKEEKEGVTSYGLEEAEKSKRKNFVRLVNQLMLKLEKARAIAGEQYVNEDVLCNPLFKHYKEGKREKTINDEKHIYIGSIKDIYYYDDSLEHSEYGDIFIEDLGNNNFRLVIEEDSIRYSGLQSFYSESSSDIITIDELQKFCNSICQYCSYFPEASTDLTERMIEDKKYFDDNRFVL